MCKQIIHGKSNFFFNIFIRPSFKNEVQMYVIDDKIRSIRYQVNLEYMLGGKSLSQNQFVLQILTISKAMASTYYKYLQS